MMRLLPANAHPDHVQAVLEEDLIESVNEAVQAGSGRDADTLITISRHEERLKAWDALPTRHQQLLLLGGVWFGRGATLPLTGTHADVVAAEWQARARHEDERGAEGFGDWLAEDPPMPPSFDALVIAVVHLAGEYQRTVEALKPQRICPVCCRPRED